MMKRCIAALIALTMICGVSFSATASSYTDFALFLQQNALESGFDPETNQTVTIGGLAFSVPAYFDTRSGDSQEDAYLVLFPQDSSCNASLLFYTIDVDAKSWTKELAESMGFGVSNMHYDDTLIKGISGFSGSFRSEGTSTVRISILIPLAIQKVVIVTLSVDDSDMSKHYYEGDFRQIIQSARLVRSQSQAEQEDDNFVTPIEALSKEEYRVTKEYYWSSARNNHYAMVLKNTSGIKCGYDIRIIFMDKDDNIVGVFNDEIQVCDNGYEVLVPAYCDMPFDHVECDISITKATRYDDIHDFVSVTAQKAGNKAILTAKNAGDKSAEFVEYQCLFLDKNGEVIDWRRGYLIGSGIALEPGKTEMRQEEMYEPFDSVMVYYTGWCRSK